MTKHFLTAAVLMLVVLPAFAQMPPETLTPPHVLGGARTIEVTVTLIKDSKAVEVSTAALAQPNKAYVVDTDVSSKSLDTVYVSDGKMQTEYSKARSRYTRTDAPAHLADIDSQTLALSMLTDFLGPKEFARFHPVDPLSHSAVDTNSYEMSLGTQDGKTTEEVLAVDSATGLPKSVSIVVTEGGGAAQTIEQINFNAWKLNAPVSDTVFAYTPPADAKLYVPPQLLANGTAAPDFTVQDKDGKPVKLSDYRGKTVVLDFWATWCGPCQMSLPHTATLAKQYAGKNVVMLAVNVWDTAAAFQAWLPKHPEYAPLNFAIDANPDQSKSVATALYGVSGIPTQYVIDPTGKIIKSIVGYESGDTQLEDVLKAGGR